GPLRVDGGLSLSQQNQQDFRPVQCLMMGYPNRVTGFMKIDPKPSDREVLAGLVERVTYQNAESGFCVVRVRIRGRRELVTLVGHAAAIAAGEWITATGNWVNDAPMASSSKLGSSRPLCPHRSMASRGISPRG